ncbi:MAG TPA: hypothetical protein PK490_17205 [Prosthecobacter sp.]|nr:hypothetical protein [Prosthecobacter sp.]
MNPAQPILSLEAELALLGITGPFAAFLNAQHKLASALDQAGDVLRVTRAGADRFLLGFQCRTLIGSNQRDCRAADCRVMAGIWFPQDYLRRASTAEVVTLLDPRVFHPNLRGGVFCFELKPGMGLRDLAHVIYELLSWQTVNTVHGLDDEALDWARVNRNLWPLDTRPLFSKRAPAADKEDTGHV